MIELLIAIVVLGVLMAVAYPSYQSQIRKTRRAEAFTALSNIQQAQERHRSTRAAYTDLITAATTATPPGLAQPNTRTSSGYYDLAITLVSGGATSYDVTATAVSTTSQGADTGCSVLGVRIEGGNIRYGAGTTTIDWTNPDPMRCWAR